VEHLRAAASVKHPELGEIKLVSQPVRLSRTPASLAAATPALGEHTDEVLRELGYDDGEIAALRAERVV